MSVAVAAHEAGLKLSYARARLADVERMRQVYLASLDGVSQREIARAARLSQAGVHRMIIRAKALQITDESIEEIVLQRFVGLISSGLMMTKLQQYQSWRPRVVDPVDGVLGEDSQAELDELLEAGFLTEAEADLVLAVHD